MLREFFSIIRENIIEPLREFYFLLAEPFNRYKPVPISFPGEYKGLDNLIDKFYQAKTFNSFGGKIKSIFDINILSPSHFYLSKKGKLEDKL